MDMKRVILTLLFGVMAFAISSFARADLLSLLATPPNNENDVLQDRSWGIGVQNGNVTYGLAAFDNITVNGETINIGRSAWFVFAVQTKSSTTVRTFYDVTGPQNIMGYDHDPVTSGGYTLDNLIGVSGLAAKNALLVLVDGIDYENTTYFKNLRKLKSDEAADKSRVDSAIYELKTYGTPIVAFGLEDSQDFFFIESQGNPRKEFMGLSVVWTASGVDKNSFRPLFAESNQRVDLTQFEFSLRDFASVTIQALNPEQGVFAYYTDRATALVNYVPEPGSVIGLLTLGFAAAGVRLARRRRK
jgi:hypothetical protein